MPSDVTKSVTVPLGDEVGDQIAAVFNAEGENGDKQVWKSAPRKDTPYPYAIYEVRETPSEFMGNKDDDPVRAVVEAQVWGKDDATVDTLGAGVQEKLCDASNPPSLSGFHLVWHDLVFHEPVKKIREDADNIYGRVLEVEYQLNPT